MKRIIFLFTLVLSHQLFGFHAGIGFGWNTIDETFKSDLITSADKSGKDRYEAHVNRLAPIVTIGHQFGFCDDWIAGLSARWKYLNYKTPNENSSRGQILPNATFSSVNIFGRDVIRDFTSKTALNNEVILLGSFGKQFDNAIIYVGLGPVFFDASNRIFVSSVHTPNGVGDHLISTSVKKHKIIWGGAVQAGCQYFFNSCYFISLDYSYLRTGRSRFKNRINTAILNGSDSPGSTTLFLKRTIEFTVQEFVLSMNLLF